MLHLRFPRGLRAPSIAALGVVLGVVLAPSASAQQFDQGLADPRLISPAGLGPQYSGLTGAGVGLLSKKPSYGVEAGEFIIQPRFFLESNYRSNFFRVDARVADPMGVMSLQVRPGVAMFNPQYDKIAVSLGLDVDVFVPVSGDEVVANQTNVGGTAKLAVAFFPKGALTLTLHEHFSRTLWMRPTLLTNANRNANHAGLDLSFRPGGRALDFTLGYAYRLSRFDDLSELDTDEHIVRFLASWRFYPMTYAFLEATANFFDYRRTSSADEVARPGNFVPGSPVKVYAGVSGYLTERVAILARAGYANSMLDRESQDFSSFVGQLQASYRFSAKSILHAGVARDMELVPLGGYMQFFRAYAAFTQRIGELAELHLDFAYDIRNYGEWVPGEYTSAEGSSIPVASDPNRGEDFLRIGVLLDFDLSRLFGVTVGYRYEGLLSDFTIVADGISRFVAYDDHRVFASLNLRY